MELLKVCDISYVYRTKNRTVYAINGISCSFESGKFYAIVGKSGSGKTTLLSLLAGLDLPVSGEILYRGNNMSSIDLDRYRRENASVVYQSFNLFPLLTAIENVEFPLLQNATSKSLKSETRAVAQEKLLSVGIQESQLKSYPSMLSGGEQQRVAIARALAAGGEIILADEPTGNLDTENGKNIIDILLRLAHEQNYCVIVVTHDLAIADRADVVLNMRDGKLDDANELSNN